MLHGRPEFEDIQPPAGMYPDDMPAFLLIGLDLSAPDIIEEWAKAAEARGQHVRAEVARDQKDRFIAWQQANSHLTKWPMDPAS